MNGFFLRRNPRNQFRCCPLESPGVKSLQNPHLIDLIFNDKSLYQEHVLYNQKMISSKLLNFLERKSKPGKVRQLAESHSASSQGTGTGQKQDSSPDGAVLPAALTQWCLGIRPRTSPQHLRQVHPAQDPPLGCQMLITLYFQLLPFPLLLPLPLVNSGKKKTKQNCNSQRMD